MKKILLLLTFLSMALMAQSYYMIIYNPNSQELKDFQVRAKLPSDLVGKPIAIKDLSGNSVLFCYETSTGECTTNPAKGDGYIWVKVPSIPANGNVKLIVRSGTNGAVEGNKVFELYDDFNEYNGISDSDVGWNTQVGPWLLKATSTSTAHFVFGYDDGGTKVLLSWYDYSGWRAGVGGWAIILTSRSFNAPFVVEGRARALDPCYGYDNDVVVFFSPYNDVSDFYSHFLGFAVAYSNKTDYNYIWVYIDGNTFKTSNEGTTIDPGYWRYFRITYNPNSAELVESTSSYDSFMNGNYDLTSTSNYATWDNVYIGLSGDAECSSAKAEYDWIRVRKYAPQEPTVTFKAYIASLQTYPQSPRPLRNEPSTATSVPVSSFLRYYVELSQIYSEVSKSTGYRATLLKGPFQSNIIYLATLAQLEDLYKRFETFHQEFIMSAKKLKELLRQEPTFDNIYNMMNLVQRCKVDISMMKSTLNQMIQTVEEMKASIPLLSCDYQKAKEVILGILNAKIIEDIVKYRSEANKMGGLDEAVKCLFKYTMEETIKGFQNFEKEMLGKLNNYEMQLKKYEEIVKLLSVK